MEPAARPERQPATTMPVTLRNRNPRRSRLTQTAVTNTNHAEVHGIGQLAEPGMRTSEGGEAITRIDDRNVGSPKRIRDS